MLALRYTFLGRAFPYGELPPDVVPGAKAQILASLFSKKPRLGSIQSAQRNAKMCCVIGCRAEQRRVSV